MAAAGDIFKVALFHTLPNASQALNVFYWAVQGAGANDDDVKDTIETFFVDEWAPIWALLGADSSSIDYGAVDVVNSDGTLNRTLGTFTVAQDGNFAVDTMPAAVSVFMTANTDAPKVRGRKYIPGVMETAVDDGKLTAGTVTTASALLLLYLASITVDGGTALVPGVLSRALEYFVAFNASGLVNDIPAYQRRRKPGVGS